MNDHILHALTGFVWHILPEFILGLMACVLFLGSTFKRGRRLWGSVALVSLALAVVALGYVVATEHTLDHHTKEMNELSQRKQDDATKQADTIRQRLSAIIYAAPVQPTRLALFFKIVALATGYLLVLLGWNDPDDAHAGEYHGCLLLIVAGTALCGAANDLITMFLALELVSIPTYILLYLSRHESPQQEAAMKYFLLSIFSSGLLLFGFSYLYGITGTTNIPAIIDALTRGRNELASTGSRVVGWPGLSLVALVMIVAGLGFRITAVPFHFYAPDVYQGATTPAAGLLAFIPKVVGFAALLRLLGMVPPVLGGAIDPETGRPLQAMGEQVPVLLWIMAAVTMSLGNVLALLQDNIRRMLAYSSVAHAGYMLIGLAVVPHLGKASAGSSVGGVEALLFYLVAYGAMTVGAFAVLAYLETPRRRVEKVDDLAGLARTHPGVALLMLVFLFSLIGMPLTAGFTGKFMLFFDAMGLTGGEQTAGLSEQAVKAVRDQVRLYRVLAVIAAINAAIGGWYYLRVAAVMYLREAVEPIPQPRSTAWPALACGWLCALLTLGLGIYPMPLVKAIRSSMPNRAAEVRAAVPAEAAVARKE